MHATGLLERNAMPARVVDTRGLLCPYPFIEAKRALESLPSGAELEILTDSEPTAVSSIPILCAQGGYPFASARRGDVWQIVIRKP
ncbi:MAG TPA: sulfurtransferase TusA family protein [Thermoplasmata archaeon]